MIGGVEKAESDQVRPHQKCWINVLGARGERIVLKEIRKVGTRSFSKAA